MSKKEFPILYILANGKKRFWQIWISPVDNDIYIHRKYGYINGKISEPSPKKATSLKSAMTEATALWKKKKESGFSELSDTTTHKTNTIKPMGAHKLDDYYHKIKYPACVQTKLDGFRCLSNNGILYSKGMKPFVFLHHIKEELSKITGISNSTYFDGELYEFGVPIHEISSLVMRKYADNAHHKLAEKISYYIFDMFDINNLTETFAVRYQRLTKIFKENKFKYLKLVKCASVSNYEEVQNLNNKYILEGFEGVIVRNYDGLYKLNSRSYDVLRTKEFKKREFEIIGAKAGMGTQRGAVVWQLKCGNKSFWAIPLGSVSDRIKIYKEYLNNPLFFIGKKVNVKFLDMDKDGCVTRNPIIISYL